MQFFLSLAIVFAGVLLGFITNRIIEKIRLHNARNKAEDIVQAAQQKAESDQKSDSEIEQELNDYRDQLEQELDALDDNIDDQQDRVDTIKERLEGRNSIIEGIQEEIDELKSSIDEHHNELDSLNEEIIRHLEEKANEDREKLLEALEDEEISNAKLNGREFVSRMTSSAESKRDRVAARILGRTIPRCDVVSPVEVPTAALKFPDQDAYEQFQEFYEEHEEQLVEEIDSEVRFEPESDHAVVETLKPIDKEIAYRTLNNIIQQKKFYYDLVEKGVKRYTRRVNEEARQAANRAMNDCQIDSIPDLLLEKLSVLKFRTSFGQQQLVHSREVAHLGAIMAEEIGADVQLTRRAGLLHDAGKAIDRQRDSGHAVVGAELAENADEHPVVINAIGSHHGDMEPNSVESILVAAADAISGSRPGARRENVTNYSERIQSLLELAEDRSGINKVYAMNAGRELRIRVDNNTVQDQDLEELAQTIASDIEEELTYSGEIKINTIRETRVSQTADNS